MNWVPRIVGRITRPHSDDALEDLERRLDLAAEVSLDGELVLGLGNVVRLARRCLALEESLRGDPGHDVTAAVCRPTQDRTKALWNWERMGRALLALTGPFEPGRCRVCGCTRITACDVQTERGSRACGWVEGHGETLCDRYECVAAALVASALRPSADTEEIDERIAAEAAPEGKSYQAASIEASGVSAYASIAEWATDSGAASATSTVFDGGGLLDIAAVGATSGETSVEIDECRTSDTLP